ncbi:MAG: excinuclease ABC subunit C, partial [Bacteroidales bacterium]
VANTSIRHVDVFSIVTDDRAGYVNYMKVMNGSLIQAHSMELKKRLDESESELLTLAVFDMRSRLSSDAPELIVPFQLEYLTENVKVTVPRQGDKKSLLDLSLKNALYFKYERQKQQVRQVAASSTSRKLETLRRDLRLSDLPVHIECFDNSNTQGTNPVAACVVFRNAAPNKKDYRHFNIKTVTGPDDYASMEEVVFRRYRRMLDEGAALPQLIIIDGGKGQLGAALKSLEKLGLRKSIALIGIAKRLEEIYFPEDPVPLYLDKKSESLRIIQQIRDEAHRFGITHHRKKREKSVSGSVLDGIRGIGEQTRDRLLQVFDSPEAVRSASFEEIARITGPARAKRIREFFDRGDK